MGSTCCATQLSLQTEVKLTISTPENANNLNNESLPSQKKSIRSNINLSIQKNEIDQQYEEVNSNTIKLSIVHNKDDPMVIQTQKKDQETSTTHKINQYSGKQIIDQLNEVKRKGTQSHTMLQIEKRKNIHRGTIGSICTLKLGADCFVNLKQGSIHKYYTRDEVLGQGAYGKVWKVTHRTTGLIRAMKQLKKSALIKEEQQRLFAEMNILKNLDHPHIVKLYELYQDEQYYYLITEYLSGGELFDRIKKMNYFSEKKAAQFMGQILSAIVYCHDQKIVHRDIKPENILFVSETPNSHLKVIDFGTSRKFNSEKNMTKKLGTPYYIAPEVIRMDYNEKCDVWSCGIILYILLCGYPPYIGKNEQEILKHVEEGDLNFDPDDWNLISKEAKNLITKMLHQDHEKRITAREALIDPWMQKHKAEQMVSSKVLQNLQQFQAKSVFQQAIMTYIASQMTSQVEIDELQKTFQGLDSNHDGMLSKDELIEGYLKYFSDRSKAEEEVDKILELVDTNQSGKVDFTEFLMAAMNKEKLLSSEKIKAAFQVFDQNEDGMLSRSELQEAMGEIDEQLWKQFLLECGNSKEGFITEQEFVAILMQKW